MDRTHQLHQHYKGSTLSSRITAPAVQENVIETIRLNMQGGIQLQGLVTDLKSYTTEEDIAQSIRGIEAVARSIIGGYNEDYAGFKSIVESAKADILAELEAGSESKLQKAYLKVLNAAGDLNEAGLDKAIENAVDKKFISNAYRIASTEINRAYNQEAFDQAVNDPDCEALRVSLSSRGDACEDCVDVAEQDNGAGPGVYGLDDCPEVPIHPHCMCMISLMYVLPDGSELEDSDIEGDKMEESES